MSLPKASQYLKFTATKAVKTAEILERTELNQQLLYRRINSIFYNFSAHVVNLILQERRHNLQGSKLISKSCTLSEADFFEDHHLCLCRTKRNISCDTTETFFLCEAVNSI